MTETPRHKRPAPQTIRPSTLLAEDLNPPSHAQRVLPPDTLVENSRFPIHRDQYIIAVYAKSYGSLSETARQLGTTPQALNHRLSRSPELRQAFANVEDALLDRAETQLHRKIEQGDLRAIMFFLERKGRNRGYGKDIHITSHSTSLTASITANMSLEEATRLYQDSLHETLTDQIDSL